MGSIASYQQALSCDASVVACYAQRGSHAQHPSTWTLEALSSDSYYNYYPKGLPPLHIVAGPRHYTAVQLLLETGVDPSAVDADGMTALHLAAGRGHEPVVQLLLRSGADLSIATTGGHFLSGEGDNLMAELLADKTDSSGVTKRRPWQPGYTTVLIEKAPGHLAVYRGGSQLLAGPLLLLLKIPSSFISVAFGATALHLAAGRGDEPVVRLLLENSADLSGANKEGSTALHVAAAGGHGLVVQLLLEKGADLSVADNEGKTALQQAAEHGHELAVQLLLEKAPTH